MNNCKAILRNILEYINKYDIFPTTFKNKNVYITTTECSSIDGSNIELFDICQF